MNNEFSGINLQDYTENKFTSISKWTKVISIIFFISAVLFFAASFLPFIIKRTENFDPNFVSGAHSGTIQLTLFVLINMASITVFILGLFLFKISAAFHEVKSIEDTVALNRAILNIKLFFKLFGILALIVYISAMIVVMVRILG